MKKLKCPGYGKIKAIIFISHYMVKKYGAVEAIIRMKKYKYKYSGGFYK